MTLKTTEGTVTLKHISGPKNGPTGVFRDIHTPQDYLGLLSLNPLKQDPFVAHVSPLTGHVVYVNEGRLLLDCNCGAGVLVDAEWQLGCCFSCGAIYEAGNMVLPDDLTTLDTLLGTRHPSHRNFHPERETVQSVRDENTAKGVA